MPDADRVAAGGARALKGGACAALRAPGGRERGNAPGRGRERPEEPRSRARGGAQRSERDHREREQQRSAAPSSGGRSADQTPPPEPGRARARAERTGGHPAPIGRSQRARDEASDREAGRSAPGGATQRPPGRRTHAPAPPGGAGIVAAYRVCWRRFKRRRQQPGRVPPAPLAARGEGSRHGAMRSRVWGHGGR